MLENFIYAKQKSLFEEALNNGEVLNEAIVFIEDTKEIWNHGTYFATRLSIDEIENIVSSSETVQSVMEQVVLDTLDSLPVSIVSDGDGSKFLADDGSYKEIVVPTKVSELEDDLSIVTLNDSTPIAESLVGDELIPIKQNGEDKAVTATDLIKDAKELFEITPNSEGEFPTILTKDYLNNGLPVINAGAYLTKSFTRSFIDMGINFYEDYYIVNPAFKSGEKASVIKIVYVPTEPDRPISLNFYSEENIIPLFYDGDGTKFLADDGTYKEVSGGSEPYNFDTNKTEFTEEELEEFLTAVSSGTPIMSYMDGINIPFSVVPRFSSGETIGYYLIAIVGDMESGNNPLLFYIYISKSDRSITSKTASDGSVHHIATEESVNALAPYIWNGTTSETIYYEIIDCIVSGRTIMYSRTDTNDDGLYHICTSSAIGSQTAYLTFSDTYRHGTFKMLVTEDQVLRVQGLIPFYSCDSGSNTSIEAGTYNSVNIKNNTEIVYDTTINGVQQRYEGEFSFGDTVYTVTFPDTVTWTTIPESYKPDTTYQFKILNNIGNIWEVGKGEVAYKSDIPTKVNDLEDGPSIVTSIEEAKELFIVTPDMFEQTATTAVESIPTILTFTDDGWSNFTEAVGTNKIIALDYKVAGALMSYANPLASLGDINGYFILTGLKYDSTYRSINGFLSWASQAEDSPAIYIISFEDKNVVSIVINTPSETYIIDETMFTTSVADEPISSFELTDEYKEFLERAISTNKVIGISNLVLYYLVQSISTSNINTRGTLPSGFSIINLTQTYGSGFVGHVYYGTDGILLRVICNVGVITVEKETMLLGSGDGSKFLADNGNYKEISNAVTVNLTDSSITEEKYNEIYEAINNGIPINVIINNEAGGNFIGIKQADATKDPGGNVCLYYTVSDDVGHIRFCESFINSNDYSVTNLFTPINDLKDVYVFSLGNITSSEDFTNLKAAIDSNKVIMIGTLPFIYGGRWSKNVIVLENSTSKITLRTHIEQTTSNAVNGKVDRNIDEFVDITINSDGTYSHEYKGFTIKQTGSGSAFLSDDGSYKTLTIPNNLSEFNNDVGFITSETLATNDFITTEQLDTRDYATKSELTGYTTDYEHTTLSNRVTTVENHTVPDARSNVLWIGTSIPAGDIQFNNNGTSQSVTTNLGSNNYPKMVADALGFNLYNNSRGSSFVCFYPPNEDGTENWASASDWSEYSSEVWKGYSLSASFAQVDEKFGPNGLNCPQWLINNFKSYSYESLIIPYIDGTLASCDTVVIDHGYNDRQIIINEASWHPGEGETQFNIGAGRNWLLKLQDPFETTLETETYFQGKWWNDESVSSKKHYLSALIFLAKKIWAVNPKIKIIIGNYFASKSNTFGAEFGNDRLAEFVNLANSACASWLKVNCVDVWKHTGLYNRNLPAGNDFQLFCPDGVHPHSDTTGHSNKIIAGIYINSIRGTLYI